ncbi:MAG: CRISPR-associated protein Csx19 [Zavarzinella sp.]
MSATLFVYTRQNLALNEALSAFATILDANGATAILYSPRRCELATFAEGALRASDGQRVDIGTVFEARVFSETSELRWLNDPSPAKCHQAVILTEHEQSLSDDWKMHQEKTVIEKLDQTYLLWGEGTGRPVSDGWSELGTARIGALRIPKGNVGKNQRVLLHSVEYIVEADHGNAVIFDERLLKLEVANG